MTDKTRSKKMVEGALFPYYLTLQNFFKASGNFKRCKALLKMSFLAAFSAEAVLKPNEIDILKNLHQSLLQLVEQSYKAFTSGELRIPPADSPFLDNGDPSPELYCGSCPENVFSSWDYYPRFLHRSEFIDPPTFLSVFFGYKDTSEWKQILAELFLAARSSDSYLSIMVSVENPILVHDYLFKLIEASHLIVVRQWSNPRLPGNINAQCA